MDVHNELMSVEPNGWYENNMQNTKRQKKTNSTETLRCLFIHLTNFLNLKINLNLATNFIFIFL
jgi:hypothetical protein